MAAGTPKPQVDTGKPHSARVYDALLDGKDNYRVDREMAEQLPPEARLVALQNRAFMRRAVRWVATTGIDQYLDIGTGIPTEPNLHQVVQEVVPTAKIAYADNDPIVLRHAEALLVGTPEGATDYVEADIRDPRRIIEHASGFLDFARPVALSLIAVLPFVSDEEDPYAITRKLVEELAPGSMVVISHGTSDFSSDIMDSVVKTYNDGRIGVRARPYDEVARFFDGLELVEPGLVPVIDWYRDEPEPPREVPYMYGGVARVPGR